MVIISDGKTLVPHDNMGALDNALKDLRINRENVIRLVFQVGDHPNTEVLKKMASKPVEETFNELQCDHGAEMVQRTVKRMLAQFVPCTTTATTTEMTTPTTTPTTSTTPTSTETTFTSPTTTPTTSPTTNQCFPRADVVFVLDSSTSVVDTE